MKVIMTPNPCSCRSLACSPACVACMHFHLQQCFSEMRTGALLLFVLPSTLVAVFQCPSDGHHVDPESCASFYMCANGRVIRSSADIV